MRSVPSTVGRIGLHKRRLTAVAALLLAAIMPFAGDFPDHQYDFLGLSTAQGDLPTFTAGHEQPDDTVHIEGAAATEPDSCTGCIGCLPQQRQLAVGPSAQVPGDFEPDASAIAAESVWGLASDARRLQPSRAPPPA